MLSCVNALKIGGVWGYHNKGMNEEAGMINEAMVLKCNKIFALLDC